MTIQEIKTTEIADQSQIAMLLANGGWLPENAVIDGATLDAVVRSYQAWWGLYVDGLVGPTTLASLTAPRFCKHPDAYEPPLSLGGGINRWGKKNLVIETVGPPPNGISLPDFREGVIAGARTWSAVCGMLFDLGVNGDIVIDSAHIDGPGKVLAYMQLPSSDGFMGRLAGRWGASEDWPAILIAVSAHEVGHALGLGHTNVPAQLMNPMLSRYSTPQDKWDAPQALARYGAPRVQPPVGPVPVPPSNEGWQTLGMGLMYRQPSRGGGKLELTW